MLRVARSILLLVVLVGIPFVLVGFVRGLYLNTQEALTLVGFKVGWVFNAVAMLVIFLVTGICYLILEQLPKPKKKVKTTPPPAQQAPPIPVRRPDEKRTEVPKEETVQETTPPVSSAERRRD